MKISHIVALALIAISIGVIISMTGETSSYETFATARSESGMEFHVVGELSKDKPLYYEPEEDPNYFSFYMIDKDGEEHKVVHMGEKPRDFEKSEQIVLTGTMKGEEFHASKILMKCPSKYVEDEIKVVEVKVSINE